MQFKINNNNQENVSSTENKNNSKSNELNISMPEKPDLIAEAMQTAMLCEGSPLGSEEEADARGQYT